MASASVTFAADRTAQSSARAFTLAVLTVAGTTWFLAGWAPIGFSMITVFLFAGPHNWLEGRYMLGRMPARWGPLRAYYLTGISGVLLLTIGFAALPYLSQAGDWSDEQWLTSVAVWNTALVTWLLLLSQMRSKQNPRRDWSWLFPPALALVAVAWLWPMAWDLALVYLHPIVALCFLDRELKTRKPEWSGAYRRMLALLPLLLIALWWRLASSPSLPGSDALTLRITRHAGSNILTGVSSHLLVATHVFLEMLHYGVWLVMIPLVSVRAMPWQITSVPLARRSRGWRWAVGAAVAAGGLFVVAIWAGFIANYPLTRDVYFTVAMLHVLAEAPFLLRLL